MSGRRYCTFRVAGLSVGVAIERVIEVRRDQAIVPVPLVHPDVVGLLNLRGQIVTAIDARRRLALGGRPPGMAPCIVVIRSGGEAVALLVDAAGDVVDIDEDRLEAVPETIGPSISALAVGACRLDDGLLLLLDPDEMLSVTS